jgi:hypothetical protein
MVGGDRGCRPAGSSSGERIRPEHVAAGDMAMLALGQASQWRGSGRKGAGETGEGR